MEYTREQVRSVLATQDQLIAACTEIGQIAASASWFTWQLAATLDGRNIDSLTIGELRWLAREVTP